MIYFVLAVLYLEQRPVGVDDAVSKSNRWLLNGLFFPSTVSIAWMRSYLSLESLERHKQGELHQEASKKERKISTCSLCKKQFTSPPQLKVNIAQRLRSALANRIPDMPREVRVVSALALFSLSKNAVDVCPRFKRLRT